MKHIFTSVLAILIALTAPLSSQAAANDVNAVTLSPMSATSHEILEITKTLGTEGETENIKKEILKFPRTKLATAIREGLKTGGDWSTVAARTANLLSVKEVLPELEQALQKNSDDWQVITAIGALANDDQKKSIAALWSKQMRGFSNPAKIAVIETLGRWSQPLSDAGFAIGVTAPSLEVRRAVVTNFIVTRIHLTLEQQLARYKKAFALDPYQVRLDAMIDFQSISPQERAKLGRAVDAAFASRCKAEDFDDVKIECQKILQAQIKGAK